MKLKNAARRFDTCPVSDAYSGALLFKAQTSTFLESSAEGSTASRRVISVRPEVNLPAHSCILALGQILIAGANNPDEWSGEAIRKAYWVKLATDNMTLLTPGQAASSQTGTPLFASKKYLRDTLNGNVDAELDPMWEVAVSASVTAERGQFLKSGTTLYRIRVAYKDVDGFLTLQSDEVDEPQTLVSFLTGQTLDPVTEVRQPTYQTVGAVILDYPKSYSKSAITDVKSEVGDICLIVSAADITPRPGQTLTIPSGRFEGGWRVLGVQRELDGWKLHIRRT